METLRKALVLLLVAGMPAAAPALLTSAPDLCFADGSTTYRLSATVSAPDFRVAIDNTSSRPDLRVRLTDHVAAADFALADDAGALIGDACKTAGRVSTVRVVAASEPADLTIAVARDGNTADFTLYVHSARVSHFDAAALFGLIRHVHAKRQDHASAGADDSVDFERSR
jgi:hypothetical protein